MMWFRTVVRCALLVAFFVPLLLSAQDSKSEIRTILLSPDVPPTNPYLDTPDQAVHSNIVSGGASNAVEYASPRMIPVDNGSGRIRVVAAMENVPSIDLLLGSKTVESGMPFASASASRSVAAGSTLFELAETGALPGNAFFSQAIDIQKDRAYTYVVVGAIGSQELPLSILATSRPVDQTPPPGSALVRIYHGAPRVSDVTLRLRDATGTKTIRSGLAYKSYTNYFPVGTGPFTLDFVDPYGHVYSRLKGEIPEGKTVSFVIGGSGDEVYVLDESDTSRQEPLPKLTLVGRGLVRFVNASPDAGRLEMFLDSIDSAPAEFHDATTWTDDYFAGPLSIAVAESGVGISNAFTGEDLEIKEDRLSNIVALGNKEDGTLGMVVLEMGDDVPTPGPGQVAFRWLNAIPGSEVLTCHYGINQEEHLSFKEVSSFRTQSRSLYGVSVSFENDTTSGSSFFETDLPDGAFVTAIVTQPYPGSSAMSVDLLIETKEEQQSPMLRLDHLLSVPSDPSVLPNVLLHPNPAATQSVLSYSLSRPDRVTISVQDMLGRRVATLEPGLLESGEHTMSLPVESLLPGLYGVSVIGSDGRSVGRGTLTVVK